MSISIGNPTTVNIPDDARHKTYTSFDQNYSMYVGDQNYEQFAHHSQASNFNRKEQQKLQKWISKTQSVMKKYISCEQEEISKPSSFYLIKIEQITDIAYKKLNNEREKKSKIVDESQIQGTKVYIQLFANLILKEKVKNKKGEQISETKNYSKRTLSLGVFQLEEQRQYFRLEEEISLYFHSKPTTLYIPIIEFQFIISESTLHRQVETMHSKKYLGACEVDPTSGIKSKQKISVHSQKQQSNNLANIHLSVIMSDMFKALQNLVPPNCLCSSEQSISGLAGSRLPKHLNTFSYQLDFTELFSFKMDLLGAYVPDSFLKEKSKEAQETIIMHYGRGANFGVSHSETLNASGKKTTTLQTILKDIYLGIRFHNGWTSVCKSQIKLNQKMEVQKKSIQDNKSSKAIKKSQMIKLRNYISEEVVSLPFVFMDEEAVLLIQIQAKFQIKMKRQNDKEQSYSLALPICHSIYMLDKLISEQKQVTTLVKGSYTSVLSPYSRTKASYNQQSHSKIEFYTKLAHLNKNDPGNLSVRQQTNLSAVAFNKSQAQFDKIALQKQRMIKENKKLKQYNRTRKIELNKQIPILDTTAFKQQLYRDQLERMREQRKDLQEMLSYLRGRVKEVDKNQKLEQLEIEEEEGEVVEAPRNMKNYFNSIFYKGIFQNTNIVAMDRKKEDNIFRITNLFENKMNWHLFYSGQVPPEIIRTEILEQNYSYGFLINWLNLLPINTDDSLPRKFYFQLTFYKTQNMVSANCQINPTTGQIGVCQEIQGQAVDKTKKQNQNKKQIKKVMYFEAGPNNTLQNDSEMFLQFISYLYYSSVQIKVIDFYSKIEFGECYLKLREFIRMRRNEVILKKDLPLSKNNKVRAILKVEARSFRKDAKIYEIPSKSAKKQEIGVEQSVESRQLSRISKYKKSKNIEENGGLIISKIDKIINEQFTKEEIFVNTTRMRAQIIRLEVINRKNHSQSYIININDGDKPFLNNQELIVINQAIFHKIKQTRWWHYTTSLYPNKNANILIVNQRNSFDLDPGQKATLLLYFYSQRKFMGDASVEELSGQKKGLCTERCIDVTLVNTQTNQLVSIYKLHIIPEPEYSKYSYQLYRKSDSKVYVEIQLPSDNDAEKVNKNEQDFVIYIDDPTVLITYDETKSKAILQCFAGVLNQCKKLEVSVMSPLPQNKLLATYSFSIWGCQQIVLENKLWEQKEFLLQVHNSACLSKGYPYICVFSEDETCVNIKAKNPVKVNSKQSKTMIRAVATPRQLGKNYYTILVAPPLTLEGPSENIIYRYCLKLVTKQPDIKQKLTLRIKMTDKILEEPFGYVNSRPKRLKLKIYSTAPHVLWSTLDEIEVQPRSEKRIKIKINAEMVIGNQKIVLSFMSEKHTEHYQFNLELDSLF